LGAVLPQSRICRVSEQCLLLFFCAVRNTSLPAIVSFHGSCTFGLVTHRSLATRRKRSIVRRVAGSWRALMASSAPSFNGLSYMRSRLNADLPRLCQTPCGPGHGEMSRKYIVVWSEDSLLLHCSEILLEQALNQCW
jgi:hypothetical protein